MKGYTAVADPDTSAKAIGKEMPISPKFTREICGLIRGMKVNNAIKTLEGVIALETPVPLKRYNKRVSHKQGVGPGRYPKKAATAVLGVIKSAVANASQQLSANVDAMFVKEVVVNEGPSWKRFMPRAQGRATKIHKRTAHITVIIAEGQE